ncbi:MAG TPA: hypothetical protein VK281_01125, partial [Xanthobacteraceae bacterium]|nr:hypothetical protein [Xanthobacteraceae bacterium]
MTDVANARGAAPAVGVLVEAELWATEPASTVIVERAIAQSARLLPLPAQGEVAVVLADDATVRA